ncbi:MAG: hypothetical protein Tsb0034_10720 [Ekhidna sp.]
MNFIRQIERLKRLNKLIEQEQTGTPDELAARLGIKRRTLYDLLENIKALGAEVEYDRKSKTFYYRNNHKIDIDFSLHVLREGEVEKIYGGSQLFSFRAFFPHGAKLALFYHR